MNQAFLDLTGRVGTIDWILLAVLALSVLVGLWRGFVFEVLSLLGWVAAYFAAQWLAPWAGLYLPIGGAGSAANHAAAFVLCFIAALIIWGLMARVIRRLVNASPLSLVDRLLGAMFGLTRGLVLLLAVTSVAALTPVGRTSAWADSVGAGWLTAALQGLKPMLPIEIAQHLPGLS